MRPQTNVKVDEEVLFEVRPGPRSENIEYRFYFGDGDTFVTKEPWAKHSYKVAKPYKAHADVRLGMLRDREFIVSTPERDVEVFPQTKPPPASGTTSVAVSPAPYPGSFGTAAAWPTATPVIHWREWLFRWRYHLLGGLLVVAVLTYLLLRKPVSLLPPTFHPHWDRGAPQTGPQENIAINYEMHFVPNLVEGEHGLDMLESNLVTSIRWNNG